MKNLSQNRKQGARGGFTILELVVTVTVFGILTAAAAVSWVSFSRYQQLRESAGAFHKELLALKAKALENGDTIRITYIDSTSYKVVTTGISDDNATKNDTTNKKLGNAVTFGNKTGDWKTRIKILPYNLNAFDSGTVVIKSSSTKKEFRIQKDANGVKPELYYRSGSGGTWKKM